MSDNINIKVRLEIAEAAHQTPDELASQTGITPEQAKDLLECYEPDQNNAYLCVDLIDNLNMTDGKYNAIKSYIGQYNPAILARLISGPSANPKLQDQYLHIAEDLIKCNQQTDDNDRCMAEIGIQNKGPITEEERRQYELKLENQYHKPITGELTEEVLVSLETALSLLPPQLAQDLPFVKELHLCATQYTNHAEDCGPQGEGAYIVGYKVVAIKSYRVFEILHEIGHSFDRGAYGSSQSGYLKYRDLSLDFRTLSGWTNVTSQFDIMQDGSVRYRKDGKIYHNQDEIDINGDGTIDSVVAWYNYYHEVWVYKKGADFITDYATWNPKEDFADTFLEFVMNPKKLKEKCPNKFQFMINLFGTPPICQNSTLCTD